MRKKLYLMEVEYELILTYPKTNFLHVENNALKLVSYR